MPKNSNLSANKYFQRLDAREMAIYQWLKSQSLPSIANQATDLLKSLDHESIANEFASGMNLAVDRCLQNNEIKGLDFSWYFGGNKPDTAYAYALDGVTETAILSKTDLGDKSLPGIECNLEHGSLIDEEFSHLPVFYAINLYVDHLQSDLKNNEKGNPQDTPSVVLNLFEIWNYKLAIEVCETLPDEKCEGLAAISNPFWITMTRHERLPIAIAEF